MVVRAKECAAAWGGMQIVLSRTEEDHKMLESFLKTVKRWRRQKESIILAAVALIIMF